MNAAPGLIFDEAKHEYFYNGKQLSGVTGLISKKLGLKYSNEFVGEAADEGIHIHKAVQNWIKKGNPFSVHPGVTWLVTEFGKLHSRDVLLSEMLVSDFKQYASAVDIVVCDNVSGLTICDIKSGKFNREYVTWQLSIYKYFIELLAVDDDDSSRWQFIVRECICISLKDKEFYHIFPKSAKEVEKFLYGG